MAKSSSVKKRKGSKKKQKSSPLLSSYPKPFYKKGDRAFYNYCWCKSHEGNTMIQCSSNDKKCIGNHWYHIEHVGISAYDANSKDFQWICSDCNSRKHSV